MGQYFMVNQDITQILQPCEMLMKLEATGHENVTELLRKRIIYLRLVQVLQGIITYLVRGVPIAL